MIMVAKYLSGKTLSEDALDKDGKGIHVLEAGRYLESFAKTTITYDTESKEVTVDSPEVVSYSEAKSAKEDEGMKALLDQIKKDQEPILNTVIGKSSQELDDALIHYLKKGLVDQSVAEQKLQR